MGKINIQRTLMLVVLLAVVVALRTTAEGATLADLFAGDSMTVGNARFSNWEMISLDATAQSPLLSQIFVTPLANDVTQPGLQFSTNGHLATTGINSLDMLFRYRVSILPTGKAFVGQSLGLTGITLGGVGGIGFISEELATLAGADLGSTLVMADNETDFVQNADSEAFTRQFSISVTTNIFLTGVTAADTINLTSFTQRFSQTGPQSPAGDFDLDGDVDGRDFLVWQRGNSPNPLGATDLADWQENYGAGPLASSRAVPEPGTYGVFLAVLLGCISISRRAPQFSCV